MSADEEFDIDLTNYDAEQAAKIVSTAKSLGDLEGWEGFEADQQRRAYEGESHPGAEHSVETQAPAWDDQRGFWELWSEESIWKGKLLLDGERVHPNPSGTSWAVEGSELYSVHKLGSEEVLEVPWYTCNCPNGSARGGRPSCYHTAAVAALDLGIDLSEVTKPEKKRPARG
jgi:hypothetical protein